ncbi:flavin-containing monooxygenase [Kineococcus rubinsiae]|uniref:flavin-containing monooxygenase n=1 Tax=Kineococcus rubinsiae TaxID=2609562 RepID=UPI0014302D48|nr:NAD(P)/FAD-dependent oxidoreductase [Kineococcus rubinsiae]NIZ91136.1 NAD(P)/FAD-dependent oxidoreductase [Kineococcus rubinsiae]
MSGPPPAAPPSAEEQEVDVVVVGAGFAGLGTAVQLARRGRESFVVLERAAELGGTWRDNTYPGVACDIPSHLYSFSFAPKPDWSRVFAPGAEIQEYLRDLARDEGVLPHLRTGADVLAADWDGARWRVRTTVGTWRARALVVAVGRLSEPRFPVLPGLAGFGGEVVHSSRWRDAGPLAGRRVGVVGTGASAVQLVPALAREAAGVVVFQRSAPYVVPREDRPYSAAERAAFSADPSLAQRLRAELFDRFDEGIAARRESGPEVAELRRRALDHLAAQVPDAGLRAALTPDYEVGCKRVLLSDDYYPTLQRADVVLEPAALQRLEPGVAVAANGARHELDALVLATGFLSTTPPFAARVRGRGGLTLAEHWAQGMVSFASTVVHGFPSMFVLDGPNASLGHNSAVHMIETQIGYLLGALDHLARDPAPLEVTRDAERAYTAEVDELSAATVWLRGGCRSWYVDERSGRQTLLWPASGRSFAERNGTFDPAPFGARPVSS